MQKMHYVSSYLIAECFLPVYASAIQAMGIKNIPKRFAVVILKKTRIVDS